MVDQEKDDSVKALKFPCEFPVKVVGKANENFELIVLGIVKKHYPNLAENSLKQRESKQGAYLAFTITVPAQSQAQLDALYQDLSQSPEVIMAL